MNQQNQPETESRIEIMPNQLWLSISPSGRVATLHFDCSSSRNAISLETATALFELGQAMVGKNSGHSCAKAMSQKQLQCFVLRSHCQDVFLSGGHLRELAQANESSGQLFITQMLSFTDVLRAGPLVSVALLNGVAVGGGAEIALATDLRASTAPSARLEFAQAAWGVPAGWGMMTDLRIKNIFASERRRGISMAAQESLDLERLQQCALLDARFELCDDPMDKCEQWIEGLAARLARCPDKLKTKLILERPHLPADKLDEYDKTLFEQHWLQAEHKTRLAAFLELRNQHARDPKTNDTP